jgi:multicomponent Na+:H+ antiporter subunit B
MRLREQPPPRRRGELSYDGRKRLFLIAAAGLGALLAWGLLGLPAFGDYAGPYGNVLNAVAVPERHATAVVTAINFDYRGFDTLGEEFILFAAVLGLALILREGRDEHITHDDDDVEGRTVLETSSAVRVATLAMVGPTVLLAVYVTGHGQLTPGGGFQGGVIGATALLLVYLGGEYGTLRRVRPLGLVELGKAAGAGAFVLIGIGGLIFAGEFLENFLPLGKTGELLSAGTIPLLSVAVGLEVAGGLVLLLSEFLEQTIVLRKRTGSWKTADNRRATR